MIALLAFLGLFSLNLPFPVIVLAAGLWGFWFLQGERVVTRVAAVPVGQTLRRAVVWAAIWLVPLAALWWLEGGMLFQIGLFFSKLAVVTFGSAYAVLAWMAQSVVQDQAWLTLPQMIDGLGLAERRRGR